MKQVSGILVDILNRQLVKSCVYINNGKIEKIEADESAPDQYILPGFIDAHIHIESSMLVPSQFATIAVSHGTVATISDPHEIANVCGINGIDFMIENGKTVPLKFHFGAPSCVPATHFETSGAIINAKDIETLMQRDDIYYLSEVMNYPAVLFQDKEMMEKLNAAKKVNKPIDGHAPGMRMPETAKYFSQGISTDHECFTLEEALDKINCGAKILIREGSAAKNFDALIPLMKSHPQSLMFCSDDKHPDDLLLGHINLLVAKAVELGYDLFDVLYAACLHPVQHYKMEVGTLNVGDDADFIVVNDLKKFDIIQTFINGDCVYENNEILFDIFPSKTINQFDCSEKKPEDFLIKSVIPTNEQTIVNVIEAIDGQLITNKIQAGLAIQNGNIIADIEADILPITVVNRYKNEQPAMGFIKNFGLKNCAIASTVAHDSHNIVAVGSDEFLITKAVNALIKSQGGICFVTDTIEDVMPLPIGGLMTDENPEEVGKNYERLTAKAKLYGSKLSAPFMTLSFMALPVIPSLKMTDKHIFDVDAFDYGSVEVE